MGSPALSLSFVWAFLSTSAGTSGWSLWRWNWQSSGCPRRAASPGDLPWSFASCSWSAVERDLKKMGPTCENPCSAPGQWYSQAFQESSNWNSGRKLRKFKWAKRRKWKPPVPYCPSISFKIIQDDIVKVAFLTCYFPSTTLSAIFSMSLHTLLQHN